MPEDENEPEDQEEEQIDGDEEPSTEVANGPTEQNLEPEADGEEAEPGVVEEIEAVGVVVNRWPGLSKNSTLPLHHIFELVDNSIAHHVEGVPLRVDINLLQDDPEQGVTYTKKIIVKDNAGGISKEILARALMPDALAGHWGGAVGSEHGYGMKPALASLSEQPKISTKPRDEVSGYVVETESIIALVNGQGGPITIIDIPDLGEHGTIIELNALTVGKGRMLGRMKQGSNPIQVLINRLGQRYREVLKTTHESQIFDGSDESGIFVTVTEGNGDEVCTKVEAKSPIYFQCPLTTSYGVPVEDKTWKFKGTNPVWEAEIRIGKSPSKNHHYDHITPSKPDKFHPYYVSRKNAGFDIVHRDIVIKTGWVPSKDVMSGIDDHGSTNNHLRGEIILKSGFRSTKIKNFPDENEAWVQLVQKLEDLLFKYPYRGKAMNVYEQLIWRSKKEATYTETQYVNQLKNKLSTLVSSKGLICPNFPRVESFTKDHEQQTAFGKPDITINVDTKNEIMVEAKQIPAEGRHVYQLRAYMDANDCKYGIILAPGMGDTGQAALDYLRKINSNLFGKKRYHIEHIDTADVAQYSVDLE